MVYSGANTDWGSEALLMRHLEPDSVFIDVGAQVSYYALYAAPLVRKVYAFEPDARSHAAERPLPAGKQASAAGG